MIVLYIQIILFAIAVVLFVASIFLAPKPEFEDARPKGLGDFQVPTATEDRCVPIVWGTVEMRGPNVLWYGDLNVKELTKKVSTGWFSSTKVTIGFRYSIGMHLLLCYGPVNRFLWWEVNDLMLWEDGISPDPTSGTVISIDEPGFFGKEGEGGGYVGDLRIYGGGPDQDPDPYLEDVVSADMPAYVDIAHCVWEQGVIGESERLGRWAFRVSRFPDNLSLTGDGHIVKGDEDNGDANPAEVLYEILTNVTWGLGIPPIEMDFDSFQAAGNTLATEEHGFGMIVTRLTPAINLVKEVLRQIDAVLYEDSDGKFHLKLIRDDYVVGDLEIYAENNVVELKSFSRSAWAQTFNHINISFTDRNQDFIKTGAFGQDLANVQTQNRHVRADFEYPGIKHGNTASKVARRELRQLSFPFAKMGLVVNREGQKLRPGDVIKFSWDKLIISEMVVRVLTVDQGELIDGNVELSCVEDIFQVSDDLYDDPGFSGWTPISNLAEAFVDELVRQAPRIGINQSPQDYPDPTLARIMSLAKKQSGKIIGFEQWADIGTGYEGIGKAAGTTPFGKLVNAYPANTADIEVSDLLLIDNEVNTHRLSNNVPTNILLGQNLAMFEGAAVDGSEDEIIGWEQLIDEGDGTWTLRNVHRGLCDTQARDYAAGTNLWFVSSGMALSQSVYGDTQVIDVKHLSETTSNLLDISLASALPLTFNSRSERPHHPANFTVNATRLPVATDETADLDFEWEHRASSDTYIFDANTASENAQDANIVYDLEFRHAVTQVVLRSTTLVSPAPGWLTYLYTAANMQSDTGEVGDFPLEVRMEARDTSSSLTSLQELVFQFNADIGGATVQSIDLDGGASPEYLAKTSNSLLSIADTWSHSIWVRGTSIAGGTPRSIFLARPTTNDYSRIELILTDDSVASPFQIKVWSSGGVLIKDYSFGSYAQNTWTMLTVTWDGPTNTLLVYQDSSAQTPTTTTDLTGTMGNNGRKVIVGVDNTLAAQHWAGQLFSPKTWDVVIGATEVATLAAGLSGFNARENSGNYVSRDNLVHLWDFRTSAAIGADYGHLAALIDIMTNALNIAAGDLNAGQVP